jgi:predicted DNA binding CopG/RHH family protein
MAQRKALNFKLDKDPPLSEDKSASQVVTATDKGERQQVGARVTKVTYRRLKSRAALQGVTVQALVEQAIDDFLSKEEA